MRIQPVSRQPTPAKGKPNAKSHLAANKSTIALKTKWPLDDTEMNDLIIPFFKNLFNVNYSLFSNLWLGIRMPILSGRSINEFRDSKT